MKKAIPVIAILGLFMAANPAQAAAPQLVPVQGVLLDSAGDPIDTNVTAVFSIYTSEVGGTALWTETQDVLVEDGLFTAYLGDVTTLDLTLFRDNGDLWLGIQIGTDSEMPRVLLGSNPFAAYSEWCGNHPTPDFADITGTVDPADLPASVVSGPLACTGTEKVTGVDSSGALLCGADVDTDTDTHAGTICSSGQYLNGDGSCYSVPVDTDTNAGTICSAGQFLNGDGTCDPVPVDTNAATLCSAGQFLNGDGTCDPVPTGDITGVTAGSGLTGGGTSGTVTLNVGANAITMDHVNLITGQQYISSTNLAAGTQFMMSTTAVRPTSNGVCMVFTTSSVYGMPTTSTHQTAYMRTARAIGTGSPSNDTYYGHYYQHVSGSNTSTAVSANYIWTVTGGTTYYFGCAVLGVGGDWTGVADGRCRVTWVCL